MICCCRGHVWKSWQGTNLVEHNNENYDKCVTSAILSNIHYHVCVNNKPGIIIYESIKQIIFQEQNSGNLTAGVIFKRLLFQ